MRKKIGSFSEQIIKILDLDIQVELSYDKELDVDILINLSFDDLVNDRSSIANDAVDFALNELNLK